MWRKSGSRLSLPTAKGPVVLARNGRHIALWPIFGRRYTPPPAESAAKGMEGVPLAVSRWSIRRKLLVGLAIVLTIVGALAYSGLSGGYSYKELARTIGVRAKDLKLAGELRESLGELRVSLSQTRMLENTIASDGVSQNFLRNQFHDKLSKVAEDLALYREHLGANTLSDPRFGDRSQEQQTLAEL